MSTPEDTGLTMSAEEAGDRLAIRELFDAYAHCADPAGREGADGAVHSGHAFPGVYGH
jgi:hypothetical protein